MTKVISHYVLGAGQVGCLYDFGPEFHETLEDALEAASYYLECDIEDESVHDTDVITNLREQGIHYFSPSARSVFGDYIEVCKQNGPCPDSEDL